MSRYFLFFLSHLISISAIQLSQVPLFTISFIITRIIFTHYSLFYCHPPGLYPSLLFVVQIVVVPSHWSQVIEVVIM